MLGTIFVETSELRFVRSRTLLQQKQMARIAIDNHLWIEDWAMVDYLSDMMEDPKITSGIILVYHGKTPIAASIRNKTQVQFFVMDFYRRNKIGSKMAEMWKKIINEDDIYAQKGIPGSRNFFKNVGIYCSQY